MRVVCDMCDPGMVWSRFAPHSAEARFLGGPALVPVAGRLEVGDAGSCRSASSGNEPRVALTAATSKTPRLQRNSRVGGQVGKNLY